MKRFELLNLFVAGCSFILLICINFIFCEMRTNNNSYIVNAELNILGKILKSHKGKDFYAFLGIPYAKPPIGEKRFKDPEPYSNLFTKWSITLDATRDGNICPQSLIFDSNETYTNRYVSEDCLTLNVYTRTLEVNQPVLVFIHGGGYKYGTGNSDIYQPKYLLDEDNIVLVTFNYRLGPFGFLATGTKDAPGNYGFKDQVLALQWVRENIYHFGGNPNSITLIGHSAGAMAATLHMTSPMSKDLFHRVIAMSGSATSHWYIDNVNLTKTLAKSLHCSSEFNEKMIECLRTKSWQEIVEECEKWSPYSLPNLQWNFEIEENFGQERFITMNPSVSFKTGNFHKVPIITGLTKDEFARAGLKVIEDSILLNSVNENFNYFTPKLFGLDPSETNETNKISNELKEFYFKNHRIGILTEIELGDLFSDSLINHGVHRLVQLASQYVDVFYYRLNYKGHYTCSIYNNYGEPLYVSHGDDLMYLFVFNECGPEFNDTDPDFLMIKRYTKYFTNFAKFSDPNINIMEDEIKCTNKWLPSKNGKVKTLYINETCTVSDPPNQDRFTFWDKLFPINFD